MYKYNVITGEPDNSSPNDNFSVISEQEIANNAVLTPPPQQGGEYFYDPNARYNNMMYQQPQQQMNPYNNGIGMYYGYNQNPYYNDGMYGYGQQPIGFVGNPAFQFMQQQYPQFQNPYYQPQYQDQTYVIPGFNTGSNMLLPADAEERCDRLQTQMMMEQDQAYVDRLERQRTYYDRMGFGGGYNYYGLPYATAYYDDPGVTNKYRQIIDEMREEAIQARLDFNKNLSRLAHNYLYGEANEDDIDKIYSDRVVTIPASQIAQDYKQNMLANCVPVDNSAMYQTRAAEVTAAHDRYFNGGNVDLNGYFENVSLMRIDEALEQEKLRRRDGSGLYNQNGSYRALLRQKMIERKNLKDNNGLMMPNFTGSLAPNGAPGTNFPTLRECSTLLEDGSLQIIPPPWIGKKDPVTISNQLEDSYEANRGRFIESIYQNNPRPGGV